MPISFPAAQRTAVSHPAPSGRRRIPHPGFLSRPPLALCLFVLLLAVLFPPQAFAVESAKGSASWYGTTAHGKQTANGEIYNRNALTAAHRQLPFGSVVRVRNLKNDRHVLVRINDRGPFVKGRTVDVSLRAATILRMTKSGVVPVAIEMVGNAKGEPVNKGNAFFVHIADVAGAMKTRDRMTALGDRLKLPLRAMPRERRGIQSFAICSGPYDTFQDAQRAFLALEQKQYELKGIIEGPVVDNTFAMQTTAASELVMGNRDSDVLTHSFDNIVELTALFKNSFQILPILPIHNSIVTLSLVQSNILSVAEGMSFFSLPYQGHSGYTYLPS